MQLNNGILSANTYEATKTLHGLIANVTNVLFCAEEVAEAMLIRRKKTEQTLSIVVAPVSDFSASAVLDAPKATAMVFIADNDQNRHVPASVLTSLYGLSPAEATVAIELMNGLSVDQIAKKFHRSPNTLRAQVKSIYKKTNVNLQPDLIKLLLTGPAMLTSSH